MPADSAIFCRQKGSKVKDKMNAVQLQICIEENTHTLDDVWRRTALLGLRLLLMMRLFTDPKWFANDVEARDPSWPDLCLVVCLFVE